MSRITRLRVRWETEAAALENIREAIELYPEPDSIELKAGMVGADIPESEWKIE